MVSAFSSFPRTPTYCHILPVHIKMSVHTSGADKRLWRWAHSHGCVRWLVPHFLLWIAFVRTFLPSYGELSDYDNMIAICGKFFLLISQVLRSAITSQPFISITRSLFKQVVTSHICNQNFHKTKKYDIINIPFSHPTQFCFDEKNI